MPAPRGRWPSIAAYRTAARGVVATQKISRKYGGNKHLRLRLRAAAVCHYRANVKSNDDFDSHYCVALVWDVPI